MPTRVVLSVALLILSWVPLAVSKDIALVSNKSNSLTTISMPDLVKICKAQTTRWPDGKPVTFITRSPASPDMKMVVEKVYAMAPGAVAALISAANHGRAGGPAILVVNSNEDLVRKVESTPGAIALVDVYSITGGVAVVKVGGKLPLEPGYPLHGN